jgi:hypothetical protein
VHVEKNYIGSGHQPVQPVELGQEINMGDSQNDLDYLNRILKAVFGGKIWATTESDGSSYWIHIRETPFSFLKEGEQFHLEATSWSPTDNQTGFADCDTVTLGMFPSIRVAIPRIISELGMWLVECEEEQMGDEAYANQIKEWAASPL